jgi:hypothetical protein
VAFAVVTFTLCHLAIFGLASGVVDELDFWGGTFCLVLFGTVETILFGWVFGMDRAWEELHQGAGIVVPGVYRFVIKYITPALLIVILVTYLVQDGIPLLRMKNVPPENVVPILMTRIMLVLLFSGISVMVWIAGRRRRAAEGAA